MSNSTLLETSFEGFCLTPSFYQFLLGRGITTIGELIEFSKLPKSSIRGYPSHSSGNDWRAVSGELHALGLVEDEEAYLWLQLTKKLIPSFQEIREEEHNRLVPLTKARTLARALVKYGINSLEEASILTEQEVLCLYDIGPICVEGLKRALAHEGLALRSD